MIINLSLLEEFLAEAQRRREHEVTIRYLIPIFLSLAQSTIKLNLITMTNYKYHDVRRNNHQTTPPCPCASVRINLGITP